MGLRELLEKFGLAVFDEANPEPRSPEEEGDLTLPSPTGNFNVSDVFLRRGLSPVPFTAEQALELLRSLPNGLRTETKCQAFIDLLEERSTSITAVEQDARRKVDALTAEADNLSGESADFITTTENEIAKLEAEIREKRESIERAQVVGAKITQLCRAEADRLNTLLQFLAAYSEKLK